MNKLIDICKSIFQYGKETYTEIKSLLKEPISEEGDIISYKDKKEEDDDNS